MDFIIICTVSLLALGVIAAVASAFSKGGTDTPVNEAHDCSTCASVATGECKIGCLIEEKKRQKEDNSVFLSPKQKK